MQDGYDTCLTKMLCGKRYGMLQAAILHHDNAPSHKAAQTTETIIRLCFELLDDPILARLGPLWLFSFSIDQECFERYAVWGRCLFSSCSSAVYPWNASKLVRVLSYIGKTLQKVCGLQGTLFWEKMALYCAPMCLLTMMELTFHAGAPGRAIWRRHDVA